MRNRSLKGSRLSRCRLSGLTSLLILAAPLACTGPSRTVVPQPKAPPATSFRPGAPSDEPLSDPHENVRPSAISDSLDGKPVVVDPEAEAAADPAAAENADAGPEPLVAPLDFGKGGAPVASTPPSSAKGDMWGDAIGDSFGAGGLGLSGTAEGGGGRGERIGLGAPGAIGRGAGAGSGSGFGLGSGFGSGSGRVRAPRVRMGATSASPSQRRGVAAGEWDDNANYHEFQKFLGTQLEHPFTKVDVAKRRFIVVRDSEGKAVPNCRVVVKDRHEHKTVLRTGASGRTLLFPAAVGLTGTQLAAQTACEGNSVGSTFSIADADGVVDLRLRRPRAVAPTKTVDIVFVLDTTGSMGEEISQLKSTITQVADTLGSAGVKVRLGMVEYRDRGDAFLTRMHQMTTDVAGFAKRVDKIEARGGGDAPEDVNEGLSIALTKINWRMSSVARIAFVIGDAPPQLNYQDSTNYADSMKLAATKGIHLYTIAASGMDGLGQVVWRQVAQFTGGTNMFILRGGAGPQSLGGGDPKSSCGGTHTNFSTGNLAQLIRSKVKLELATLDADPMRIAGLGKDEKAKPCDQRVLVMVQ